MACSYRGWTCRGDIRGHLVCLTGVVHVFSTKVTAVDGDGAVANAMVIPWRCPGLVEEYPGISGVK